VTGRPSPPTQAEQEAALDRAISTDRYASYLKTAAGSRPLARRLYVWDRDLSVAVLADLAIVEVGLRNAMHDALSTTWGPRWYEDPAVILDDRCRSQLSKAWSCLPSGVKSDPQQPDVPGRLVAQCMFGFWVNLLDAGDHVGKPPRRVRADYETLWRQALSKAFPGGRPEARRDPSARFNRAWTHGIAKNVNVLRNRVAHHEPLHNGFPLPGQSSRMSASDAHQTYLKLTRMIDRNLAAWIANDSKVPGLIASRPC
jgi:hypothetical protein